MAFYPNEEDIDNAIQKLREAKAVSQGETNLSDETDDTEETDDGPNPNYQCPTCESEIHIDDHKHRATGWCNDCGELQKFVRLN